MRLGSECDQIFLNLKITHTKEFITFDYKNKEQKTKITVPRLNLLQKKIEKYFKKSLLRLLFIG
jgi:hypothetical protein